MEQGTARTVLAEERGQTPADGPAARAQTVRDYKRISILLAVTDLVAIVLAFTVAYNSRFGFALGNVKFLEVGLVAPPIWIGIFAAFRLYSVQRFAPAEEFRRVIYAITIGITVIVTASYWTKADLSREWVGLAWVLSLVFVLGSRRAWHHSIWKRRRRGALAFRTLIVGTNDEAVHLASVMRRKVGYKAVGFVSTGNGRADPGELPVLSDIGGLAAAIKENQIECVYVASSALKTSDMRNVTKVSRVEGVEVRVSANIPEMLSSRLAAQPLGGLMAFSIWPVRLTGVQAIMKRTFDLAGSAVLLVILSPLFLAIAIAVKAGPRGPVLYRQARVGRRGRPFTLLKFRTMVVGADDMLAGQNSDVAAPLFKVRHDARVTRTGRWLRRWSLDELPQLANVLRGDMSLVGPRPPLPREVESYEVWHRDRLEVRPGITGLWQVSGRSDLSFDDYVRLDLFYIENWSLAFDLYLLVKTGPAVVAGKGAF